MNIAIVLVIGGAVFGAALWIVLRRIDASAARVWRLARQHHAEDTRHTDGALVEAAALEVGPIVAAIRSHEERLEAHLRAQLAAADARARALEQRASDAGAVLAAASQLARDLRALVDDLAARVDAPPPALDAPERATVEMPRTAATRVAPDAALVAAGLTRPSARTADPDALSRKGTPSGVQPSPNATALDDPASRDSGECPHAEEVTREVKRTATSATLAPMPAVAVERASGKDGRS